MAEPIRILHVWGNTQLGGAESRVMDLYRHMDRSRVQFDFLVHTNEEGHFDREIEELGGRIFRVPRFKLYNYFAYKRAVRDFFKKNHDFKAVQGHITSTASIYLPIAKKAGIPITIAHARSAGVDKGLKGWLTRWMRKGLSQKTDYMFTCSELAGISVFGKRAVEEGKTIFIPNAIDCRAFDYNPAQREKMRKQLGIENKYVIGHVGRFHYAKNHEYLLQVFAQLCRQREQNSNSRIEAGEAGMQRERDTAENREFALLLLGDGSGMEAAKRQAGELGISEKVYFMGNRSDSAGYYQAMDYFVYPSRFEGLPGTVVEAQTAGLRCLMSDSICREVIATRLVHTMSIEDAPEKWADYIRKTADYERSGKVREMQQAGFEVDNQAEIMMDFYESGSWKGLKGAETGQ